MSHRPSRFASTVRVVALWLVGVAVAHCVQLEEGGGGVTRTWGAPVRVSPTGDAPEVAVDSQGNAVAVWVQPDGTQEAVWASRYEPEGGWGAANGIGPGAGLQDAASVAMDATGNAVAVWTLIFDREATYSNRTGPGGEWGSSGRLDDVDVYSSEPQISMNVDGDAMVVWAQTDGVRHDIWTNRFTRTAAWIGPEGIGTSSATRVEAPQVAVDRDGNAVSVWVQSDGRRDRVWSNRYSASTERWGGARPVEQNNAGDASEPQIGVDGQGIGVAVWAQTDGTRVDIWTARENGGDWSNPERLDTQEGDASSPQVAVASNGNAAVVWTQSDGTRDAIWARRYTPGSGWGAAERIDSESGDNAQHPQVATDAPGNAVAIWSQSDDTAQHVWFTASAPGRTWTAPQPAATEQRGIIRDPRLAMAPNGIAVAVWQVSSSTNPGIWSNRME